MEIRKPKKTWLEEKEIEIHLWGRWKSWKKGKEKRKIELVSSAAWASPRAWSEVCNSQGQEVSFVFDPDSQSTTLVLLPLLLLRLGEIEKVKEVEERQRPHRLFHLRWRTKVSGVCVSPWQKPAGSDRRGSLAQKPTGSAGVPPPPHPPPTLRCQGR